MKDLLIAGIKCRLLCLLLACVPASQAATQSLPPPQLMPLQQQAQAATLTAKFLARHHYRTLPLDDALSEKIFDRYLKALDPERLIFVQTDIDQFADARYRLDDAIRQEELTIPFAIFNLYERRIVERLNYARELLKQNLDFTLNENYAFEREKEPWPKSEDEVRDLWRKRVKNDWLRLKLAGKDDKAIRETLDKRYGNSLSRVSKYKSEDVFQVFMNAYARSIEPHTDYLGPAAAADFGISMSLSLVGIGAVLQERDEYTTIRELVPGGPAALSNKLAVGDRIVGVGQGHEGDMLDVVGMRLDDVVAKIRGAKDTVVRLDILPVSAGLDGKHKLIALTRSKISLERQAAKKSILQSRSGGTLHKIGVIALPGFYQDAEARRKGSKDFRSASRDVTRLLEDLIKERVDGVLVDLRNNGGGSLDEAVELTCLFTGKGPVVQERNSQGTVKVDSCNQSRRIWDGPLGVLINRGSASASEIFAAAIQDYGRGIVIGESSFGKGTVQALINFDEMAHSEKPKLGELKITIAQFFRVNGGTTQLRGVTPDIGLPSTTDAESFGESSYENALPWVQILPASYTPAADMSGFLATLQSRHAARVAKDRDFQYLLEDIAELKLQRNKRQISLNETERRKERDRQEAKLKLRTDSEVADETGKNKKAIKEKAATLKTLARRNSGLQADETSLSDEIAAEKAEKDAKDVWLNEAAQILGDALDLLQIKPSLATRDTAGN